MLPFAGTPGIATGAEIKVQQVLDVLFALRDEHDFVSGGV